MRDFNHYRRVLEKRRSELNQRLQGIEHDLDAPRDQDTEERAVEMEGDEVLETMGINGLEELEAISAALTRLDTGTYGICVGCGEEISDARLQVLPATPLCRNCISQSQAETQPHMARAPMQAMF
ncbi:MAG: TraR/DksA family transcriptional regulator [Pseudomonadota bacterium]